MTAWWQESWRADPRARRLADRHYNRQSPGATQFVPAGSCVVFRHEDDAVWVTSWPLAEYVQHDWSGAWINSLFRNESDRLSSELITEAVSHTLAHYGEPPWLGIVTFVDATKIRPKQHPGYCYLMAGWTHVGFTQGGLWVYQLLPDRMPEPERAEPRHPRWTCDGLGEREWNGPGEPPGGHRPSPREAARAVVDAAIAETRAEHAATATTGALTARTGSPALTAAGDAQRAVQAARTARRDAVERLLNISEER